MSAPISVQSSTAAVAAWCHEHGLRASVVGAWVWVPYAQTGKDAASLRALLPWSTGFRPSKRRQSWYHQCGVEPRTKTPRLGERAKRRTTGRLDRYHRTISAADYVGRGPSWTWYAAGKTSVSG